MKKWLLAIVLTVIVLIAFLTFPKSAASPHNPTTNTIIVAGKTITIELADTPAERQKGLSGRQALPAGHGLLFVFDTPGYHSFWMKDMNFPIDIFWLDENYQIVDSWLNALPESYPEARSSKVPAKYVLETNVGEIDD